MTPLNLSQKETVTRRLEFIRSELADLSGYLDIDYQTYSSDGTARRNIERILENIANASIDIAKTLLAGEEAELPETYREAILKLGAGKLITPLVAETMSEIIRARNVLAHQYLDIKWQLIQDFLSNGHKAVDKFVEQVSAAMERAE